MAHDFQEMMRLLEIEKLDKYLYRGYSPSGRTHPVFGGQAIAQSIRAATETVGAEQELHSLHAYFLRPGDANTPIIYSVDPIRDGRSFATRRVVATQNGEAIFNTSMSFQISQPGVSHQDPMPGSVPGPEDLESDEDFWVRMAEKHPDKAPAIGNLYSAIDSRPVERWDVFQPEQREPKRLVWMKANGKLPDDPVLHRMILAYASDLYFLGTSMLPHKLSWWMGDVQAASLDHAIWFHDSFRADEWLLYVMESPRSGGSRGLNRGSLFTRQGVLVASTMQEGLMRLRKGKHS